MEELKHSQTTSPWHYDFILSPDAGTTSTISAQEWEAWLAKRSETSAEVKTAVERLGKAEREYDAFLRDEVDAALNKSMAKEPPKSLALGIHAFWGRFEMTLWRLNIDELDSDKRLERVFCREQVLMGQQLSSDKLSEPHNVSLELCKMAIQNAWLENARSTMYLQKQSQR